MRIPHIVVLSLALSLCVLTSGCSDTQAPPKPAPAKTTAPPEVVDPALLEKKRLEEVQKRVLAVSKILETKHAELMTLHPPISEVKLGDEKTGIQYLYEVVSPQGVFYTDNQVNYILLGNLLLGEGDSVQNFTQRPALQQALAQMREKEVQSSGSDVFDTLMLQPGLSFTYGTGENKVVVFEDPDCPACQKLHKGLEEFGSRLNLSIKMFPFVLASVHPNAVSRAKMLMCASSPEMMWKKWMLHAEGKTDMDALWKTFASENNLTDASCPRATIVDQWQSVGPQLGLSATPTIMFQNGLLAEGSMTEENFAEALEMVKSSQASQAPLPQIAQPVAVASPTIKAEDLLTPSSESVPAPCSADGEKPCTAPAP